MSNEGSVYIVLYPDGAMMPTVHHPVRLHYQAGTRFFRVIGNLRIRDLSNWYARSNDDSNFIEIEPREY
jgi:hypothetical protein